LDATDLAEIQMVSSQGVRQIQMDRLNLAIFDQYLAASRKRCKIGTVLSHHTVVWLGCLVYCACAFCLYGYGFLSGEKRSRR